MKNILDIFPSLFFIQKYKLLYLKFILVMRLNLIRRLI